MEKLKYFDKSTNEKEMAGKLNEVILAINNLKAQMEKDK